MYTWSHVMTDRVHPILIPNLIRRFLLNVSNRYTVTTHLPYVRVHWWYCIHSWVCTFCRCTRFWNDILCLKTCFENNFKIYEELSYPNNYTKAQSCKTPIFLFHKSHLFLWNLRQMILFLTPLGNALEVNLHSCVIFIFQLSGSIIDKLYKFLRYT